jgi:exopolyphosphatase/guanosine-5'-triphosphate,3'-diphosphate pyrophosphatase
MADNQYINDTGLRDMTAAKHSTAEGSAQDGRGAGGEIAAVDLGSNSFHMIVARIMDGELQVVDKDREMVRLAAGLTDENRIDASARERALDCLVRFGQRLSGLPEGTVRAVGTNTLRKAKDSRAFIREAEAALGHPIQVIAGREEARLIYLGVSHSTPSDGGQRLVIDIGGGSTEFIIGEGFTTRHRESLHMGCVSYSQRFFPDGDITHKALRRAELAAHRELLSIISRYRSLGWQEAVGASGTIKAVAEVVRQNGWSDDGITLDSLYDLRNAMLDCGKIRKLSLDGLNTERAPVFVGGAAVLTAAFEALEIERMSVSEGALREGLLYDSLGRIRHEDVRDRTIAKLQERYLVDREHAARVEATALQCLNQMNAFCELPDEEHFRLLGWAARLHEAGLAISHAGYHKHGAYLLAHSDMTGFSRQEQSVLAALVMMHRRKLRMDHLQKLDNPEMVWRMVVLLRLAVLLHHSRSADPLPPFALGYKAEKHRFKVVFPAGWLAQHPLTRADLKEEAGLLKAAGLSLKVG